MKILVTGAAGFQPCIELDEGLERFVAWFRTDY
jgi:nucleoside-diphosphate-sugar epimerase